MPWSGQPTGAFLDITQFAFRLARSSPTQKDYSYSVLSARNRAVEVGATTDHGPASPAAAAAQTCEAQNPQPLGFDGGGAVVAGSDKASSQRHNHMARRRTTADMIGLLQLVFDHNDEGSPVGVSTRRV